MKDGWKRMLQALYFYGPFSLFLFFFHTRLSFYTIDVLVGVNRK